MELTLFILGQFWEFVASIPQLAIFIIAGMLSLCILFYKKTIKLYKWTQKLILMEDED